MKKSFPMVQKKLPGGLRTILLPRSEGQTVTFLVLIGVGSRYETPTQWGLSHFLEHMFFKGTETRPTTKEIAETIDGVGGEFNAFTGEEYTGYYVKVATAHLETAADVVSDILLRPLFPKEEIEREKGVIKEEIKMYTDMPMRHIHHLWHQALFGDHPLGRRIDGVPETVGKMKRGDFTRYTKKHYHTGNAVVAVAGRFDEQKTAKLLAKLFKPLERGGVTSPPAAPKGQPVKRIVHERRPSLDQTHLMVGVPGLKHTDERRWAGQLLATVLGGGMSSRLFMAVREKRGLAYAIRTSLDSFTDAGSFVTQAGVMTDKAELALKLILKEYDRVMKEPIGREELNKAKEMARGQLVMELEETNSLAVFAAGQELLTEEVMTPDQIWQRIEAVKASDLQELANDLLAKDKRSLAMLSPHQDVKPFESQLNQE